MIIETLCTLPPIIRQFFNKILLTCPCPELRDNLDKLWRMWLYIESTIRPNIIPSHREKFEALKNQFMDLYVRTLAKEKELKEETEAKAKEFLYHITMPDKRSGDIFFRLGQASYKISYKLKYNNEIS